MLLEAQLAEQIIGSAIEVHREMGPGLLESAYCVCLAREFDQGGIKFRREVPLPAVCKGVELDCGYRMDFVVEDRILKRRNRAKGAVVRWKSSPVYTAVC